MRWGEGIGAAALSGGCPVGTAAQAASGTLVATTTEGPAIQTINGAGKTVTSNSNAGGNRSDPGLA